MLYIPAVVFVSCRFLTLVCVSADFIVYELSTNDVVIMLHSYSLG